MLRDSLRQLGISAEVFNQHSAGAGGEIPLTDVWPEIWIAREDQFELAMQVIREFEISQSEQCDDALKLCSQCNEENPGNFECCWSCGADLGALD